MNRTRKKLLALSLAVPGLINAYQCPLYTGDTFVNGGSSFSAFWAFGDGDMHTYAQYSGQISETFDCVNYGEDCNGVGWNDPNNAIETNTFVARSYLWGITSNRYGKSQIKWVSGAFGALAEVNG